MLKQMFAWAFRFGKKNFDGPVRESNPGPLAPKARIMPLDQQASDINTIVQIQDLIYADRYQ